jgi:hypothetical protein
MADKPDTLAAAMAKAFAAIESATKSANNPHFKSKYADLTSVIEAIKPALVANGLFFTQSPRPNDKGVEIETTLHHAGGEVFSLGSLFVPADRNNAQAFGSALTYARRYALVTAFGVPVEDDDGNAAAQAPAAPKAKETPATITEDQRTELMTLFNHLGVPVSEFLAVAKIKDLRNLQAEKFAKAKAWVNDAAKAIREAKKETAAQIIDDEIPY